MTGDGKDHLKLRFAGSLVEQLGAQLYPSATATVAELVSNAWDADAAHVWVTVPFGGAWAPESEITVVDDGLGMTYEEAQEAYLVVGRKRRVAMGSDESPSGRKVHGRKGIGKLAAFGTAEILECVSVKDGELIAFRLDYEEIRQLKPTQDSPVQDIPDPVWPVHPDTGVRLENGTSIRLTRLRLKRALSQDQFNRSMARRFAIASTEM